MRNFGHLALGAMAAGLIAIAIACGGGATATSPSSTPPTNATTITIANNAVSPSSIVVSRGTQVTFVNNDSRVHDMDSDPHPEHTDCVELNQVGFLNPGQRKQTGNLNTARKCGFHDHGNPENNGLKGSITIQ